jgi:CheY-like chemotaxis protein/HPt (histidine-containing phosphotransfer) domain-containing protein
MVTAYGMDQVKSSSDSQYVDLILEKPITASDLYDAYQKTIQPNAIQYKGHAAHSLQDIRLLVVDDNEFNREVAVLSFESEGASVITLNDGQEAVNWLRSHASEVDLILMDVQMPIMDGYQATEAIRKELKLDIPIVALTAGAFEQHKQAALDSGMNDFIAKPFDIDRSIEVINKWVSNVSKVDELSIESANISTEQSNAAEEFDSEFFNREQALSYWKTEAKLKSYLVRFQSEYQSVDEQLKTLDPVAAEQLAHKLKGASAVLGLPAISHKAKALMDVYNSPSLGDVDLLIEELKTILDETWRFIDQYTQ